MNPESLGRQVLQVQWRVGPVTGNLALVPPPNSVFSLTCTVLSGRMNDEIKTLFTNLGSSYAKQLGFRDSWVFVGAKDLRSKSPYEQVGS